MLANLERNKMYSILFPNENSISEMKNLSETTLHDLGLDQIIKSLSNKEVEQNFIQKTMSLISADPALAAYRCNVFEDILNNPSMRTSIMKILDEVNFLKNYGSFKSNYTDDATVWDLLHRLDEINDYIKCVEALFECLDQKEIKSEGLINLRNYVNDIYQNRAFAELRQDVSKLKFETSDLKSVTVGINLNSCFEADSIGLISINNKYFTKSGILSNFIEKLSPTDDIQDGNEWNESYKYHEFEVNSLAEGVESLAKFSLAASHPVMAMSLASVPEKDPVADIPRYMNRITNQMLTLTTKKLKETLKKYVSITITDITNLIPEFMYYISWAEYVEKMQKRGFTFSKAVPFDNDIQMDAQGIYNMKLLGGNITKDELVTNDLDFSSKDGVYILTGANRGGKTTITQAIGQLFVMAQGGIYIPGEQFKFVPVDNVYTHFPADEDKTLDLGRLGEECQRFKAMYSDCTSKSLLLLNETFSTTSFEEGYFIARDSIRAILKKRVRTIYNTHMHKLAKDIDILNDESPDFKATSLIVVSKEKQRSFKIKKAAPEGLSYANDIAEKYGVTFEMLTN